MHVTIRNKTLLVVMFVTVTAARDETYTFDRQSCLDYAIKFARWQQPAMERGTRFAVPDTSASYTYCTITCIRVFLLYPEA